MTRTIKILIGASMAVGMSAIALPPAFAGTLTNATITGSDYYLYKALDTNNDGLLDTTQRDDNASLATILQGNCTAVNKACSTAGSPGGNVELFAQSESKYQTLSAFAAAPVVSLNGKIGGESITLSSLTATDWFGSTLNTAYGASNLANTWFNTFITKANYGWAVGTGVAQDMYNNFLTKGGFQASSDPNISYVNQDDITGKISIGLAGHYDLKAYYQNSPKYGSFAAFLPKGFQASEVVKYSYNGKTDYLYSFEAANSGLKEKSDGSSHSGNYFVSIDGVPPKKPIPEPSALLGIVAVGGLFVTKRKMQKQA